MNRIENPERTENTGNLARQLCFVGGTAAALLGASDVHAENGAIGYARPATAIVVDGDLSDWPADAVRHPIATGLWDDGAGWRDEAHFLAAFDPSGDYLYLAVEVSDESAIDLPDASPTEEDTLVVYVDADHSMRGSGPWAFRGELSGASNYSNPLGWDPQMARADDDRVEMVIGHKDKKRIYEWRIELDQEVRAGMTIGLDLILVDVDDETLDHPTAAIAWGKYANKAQRASRLGDVILMSSTDQIGTLSGNMAWAHGIEGPDLGGYRVRVRDRDDPELWFSVESDESGVFTAEVPSGYYCVTPYLMLMGPKAEYRMRDDVEVCAEVKAGAETKAPTLVKAVRNVPDHHIQEAGLIFDFDETAAKNLDAFMADYMDHFTIPGASVAIIKDKEIVYTGYYGVSNWLTQEAVGSKHLFDMGSITKPIFAFAVHRLVDQGVLDLDRPLHDYLPFEDIAHDERSRLFTARQVLSHQTGLPNWRWQNDDRQLDIAFTPGDGYRYSGEGYDYLGRVIEKLTGEELETVLMREAVEPLGMSAAVRFSKRDDWHDVFVYGHSELRAFTSQTPDEAHAAYSMMASTTDLAQVLLTWMNRGGGLSESGYAAMFDVQVDTGDTAVDTPWPAFHAIGPRILETPFGQAIGHGGLNWGQIAQFEMYEDHGVGYAVATNGDDGMHLRNALRRLLIAGRQHSIPKEDGSEKGN